MEFKVLNDLIGSISDHEAIEMAKRHELNILIPASVSKRLQSPDVFEEIVSACRSALKTRIFTEITMMARNSL